MVAQTPTDRYGGILLMAAKPDTSDLAGHRNVTIRMPDELWAKMEQLRAQNDRSLTAEIRQAVRFYLEREAELEEAA